MSENNAASGAEQPSAGGSKKLLSLVIILLVGVIVGGGVGAFVAAPMLAGEPHAASAADAEETEGEAEEEPAEKSASKGKKASTGVLYAFDNLVLNPAGTGGTRFLMVSAAFELRDAKLMEEVRTRDLEVRDVIIGVLGARTVEELADISLREEIKDDLRKRVDELFARGAVRRVYLPQFVIQ